MHLWKNLALVVSLAACPLWSEVPQPRQHFGFDPGDDYKLADYQDTIGYFQKLQASSNRIKLVAFGKSAMGKPMYVAFLSDPENLAKLEEYRTLNRRLALGLSQAALAKRIGVTQARVSLVEKAERGVGVEDLLALAEALETTPSDLVTPGVFDPIHA